MTADKADNETIADNPAAAGLSKCQEQAVLCIPRTRPRRTIYAATNKSEQFNDFAQGLMFGGDCTIVENARHEQRKVIKYNHLVANMVILYNVQWMSRKLKELQEKGHPVDAEVLKVLSP